jgi:DNA-binding NarL/FixJ family response regulator
LDPKIKIVIVDDAPHFRRAVRQTLERQVNFEVVGEAGNGDQALELAETRQPDILLMDYSIPYKDGLAVTREIKQRSPQTQIVLLSMFAEDLKDEAAEAGACLCIGKDTDLRRLPQMLVGCYLSEPRKSSA